jgi:outer membrane protein assembly factor BamB
VDNEFIIFCLNDLSLRRGSIVSLNRKTGELIWEKPALGGVEAGAVLEDGRIYFGTLGSLGASGVLKCLDAESGDMLWEDSADGRIWSAPIVEGVRVYTCTGNGQVTCYDRLSGNCIWQRNYATTARGRVWLRNWDDNLVVVFENGEIALVRKVDGKKGWVSSLTIGKQVESVSDLAYHRIFLGIDGGALYEVDLSMRKAVFIQDGYKRIFANPALVNGKLYFGAFDHQMHAFDTRSKQEIWRQKYRRSMAATPALWNGILYFGGNDRQIHAVFADTGEKFWDYTLASEENVQGVPVINDGIVYIAANDGYAYALPWHLGQYQAAASYLERQNQKELAASYYAVAADVEQCAIQNRESCQKAAVRLWQETGQWDKAARFFDMIPGQSFEDRAKIYEQAGDGLYTQSTSLAARMYLRASDLYREAGMQKEARNCEQKAVQVDHAPYLSIREIAIPTVWEACEEMSVVFAVKNIGMTPAWGINLRFAGNLARRIWLEYPRIDPGEEVEFELPLIAAAPGNGILQTHICYSKQNGQSYQLSKDFPISIKPSSVWLEIGDDIGELDLSAWEGEFPGKIKVDGTAGRIVIKVGSTRTEKTALEAQPFNWPDPAEGFLTEDVVIVWQEQPDQEVTVPNGHYAHILMDGQPIKKVTSGNYQRKDFEAGKWSSRRSEWRAVIFRQPAVRLAFRLGPYSINGSSKTGVELGVNLKVDEENALLAWQNMAAQDKMLSTDLAHWLTLEVSGILEMWLKKHPEAFEEAGFEQREKVQQALEMELKDNLQKGLCLVGKPWHLKFIKE